MVASTGVIPINGDATPLGLRFPYRYSTGPCDSCRVKLRILPSDHLFHDWIERLTPVAARIVHHNVDEHG